MPEFATVLPVVSTILIAGRFWLRATKQAGGFGLDDLFIGIGWVRRERSENRHCDYADTMTGLLHWSFRPCDSGRTTVGDLTSRGDEKTTCEPHGYPWALSPCLHIRDID